MAIDKEEICPKCQSHLEHDRNPDWENEIWICDNCNTEFSVHIEYVRDWEDIEEIVEK
tara:strand:- start:403 stop:576 length:174 start_codon:yes stop_codon:yes gene_type:complete